MRRAGCDHGIENRFSMCGLICDPRPSDEPALRHLLEVVGRVREHHRRAGERHRDARRELDALGVLGRQRDRQERVVAGLGGQQPVVTELLELRARGPISLNDGAMTPVSTFLPGMAART